MTHRKLAALIAGTALAVSACETTTPTLSADTTLTSESTAMAIPSAFDFDTTSARLASAIESRGLTLFNTIDHAAGAESAGLSLAPSKLYIFGNPRGGTPLMQANPALGLDLPLKALVYEDDGTVYVLTTDISAVTAAAGVSEPSAVIGRISGALSAIAAEATGE